ncbi:MAG: VWA domain-containing protein [Gammaproteobacteria bacterium SHHR-1]|uniref:vWA domain-containing protein n=1 Tax=Magnetovirga frankeli TaxID=947516 RepID=UPI0012937BE9|nr:VWA domain-containing protein [gamma proteobacterium SS-5]
MMIKRILTPLILLAGLLLVSPMGLAEPGQRPLLIEGKKTLYQRTLAKPGANLVTSPGNLLAQPVNPFNIYYVYAREQHNGVDWVQVGLDSHGNTQGWIQRTQLIDWNHGLTIAFRDPSGHDRVMLFRDPEQLSRLAETTPGDPAPYDFLYSAAESGQLPPESPVVAMQPKGYVDIRNDFYLVPIREYRDIFIGAEKGRMLRVSTVPHNSNEAGTASLGAPVDSAVRSDTATPATASDRIALDTGVVFVVDASKSMDPYITRTRAAVQKIYDDIARNDPDGDVAFGLVAYRDDTNAVPGLGYRSKLFADLKKGRSASDFFASVAEVKATQVSSQDFREDAYAGIKQAIDQISWGNFQARYMILITDAGAREGSDPLSGTGMSAQSLRQLARDNNIAIFVLHLLTDSAGADHATAREQYKTLSYVPGIGDLYYGVRTGAVGEFGRVLDTLGAQLVAQMSQNAPPPDAMASAETSAEGSSEVAQPTASPAADNPELAALQAKVSKLGYALRMQYLDTPEKGEIPAVFDAWIVDRDLKQPERRALDVRVLLTRDQLSELYQMLREVLEAAEEGMLSPRTFLDDIKTLAATASRDPERLAGSTRSSGGARNLADLGFITEYIEDLPYTGDIMNVTLSDWRNWPAKRQLTFIQRLEEKVQYYRAVHDHTDLWVSLDQGPVDGDSVFPVPLEMLP